MTWSICCLSLCFLICAAVQPIGQPSVDPPLFALLEHPPSRGNPKRRNPYIQNRRPTELTREDYDEIKAILNAAMKFDDELIARIFRLAFHDSAGDLYRRAGGMDGCIDMLNHDNAGNEGVVAELERYYKGVEHGYLIRDDVTIQSLMSRADFWAWAGLIAAEYSVNELDDPAENNDEINLTPTYGRRDCGAMEGTCSDDETECITDFDCGEIQCIEKFCSGFGGQPGVACDVNSNCPGGQTCDGTCDGGRNNGDVCSSNFQCYPDETETCDGRCMDEEVGCPEFSTHFCLGIDGCTAIFDFFNEVYGFGVQESVALMGAHSLGAMRTKNFGFGGPWVTNGEILNNQYFIELDNAAANPRGPFALDTQRDVPDWEQTKELFCSKTPHDACTVDEDCEGADSTCGLWFWRKRCEINPRDGGCSFQGMLNADMCLAIEFDDLLIEGTTNDVGKVDPSGTTGLIREYFDEGESISLAKLYNSKFDFYDDFIDIGTCVPAVSCGDCSPNGAEDCVEQEEDGVGYCAVSELIEPAACSGNDDCLNIGEGRSCIQGFCAYTPCITRDDCPDESFFCKDVNNEIINLDEEDPRALKEYFEDNERSIDYVRNFAESNTAFIECFGIAYQQMMERVNFRAGARLYQFSSSEPMKPGYNIPRKNRCAQLRSSLEEVDDYRYN